MTIVDKGRGAAIVLVPGIQGRWEYLRPAVDALARTNRVITFSLVDELGRVLDPRRGLDEFVEQIESALDDRGLATAVICGVSLGGLIALRFAARRPERSAGLILVSAPGPGWHLRQSHKIYARFPRLLGPLFFAGVPRRLKKEIAAAIPDPRERLKFVWRVAGMLVRAPVSPSRMAARARLIDGLDNTAECAAISMPTLLITGEHELDHVVPADGSDEYARLISGSRSVVLERTGHLGCVTRPHAFAAQVAGFLKTSGLSEGSRGHAA